MDVSTIQVARNLAKKDAAELYVKNPSGGSDGQVLVKTGSAATWVTVSGGGVPTIDKDPLPNTADSALGRAYGGFSKRSLSPVVIVTNGSSIAADAANHGIYGQIISGLQRRFPKFDGTLGASPNIFMYSDVGNSWTPSQNGLQVLNFSTGGANATTQWNNTTRQKAASINPPMHIWCIGINDSYVGSGSSSEIASPSVYKAALKSDIEYFLNNQTIKPCIVLVHGYQRPDNNVPSTWAAYGNALRELALEYPEYVVAVDTSPAFIRSEVPGNDPWGLVGSDHLHPDITGKTLIADMVLGALDVRVPLNAPVSLLPLNLSHTVSPTITGNLTVGSTLTVSTGTWFPDTGLSLTYQWRRNGQSISGANSSSYTLTSSDSGGAISVAVTASTTATQYRPTTYITSTVTVGGTANPSFTNNTAPAVSGSPVVGQTLTTTDGSWSPSDGTYSYQWLRNGNDISGATSKTYVLVSADGGTSISVRVTASKNGYNPTNAVSNVVSVAAASGGGGSTGSVWASDGFSTASTTPEDLHNRSTDNALGGSTRIWKGEYDSTGLWVADQGVARNGGKVSQDEVYIAGVPIDTDIEFKFVAVPAGNPGNFSISTRRSSSNNARVTFKFRVGNIVAIETNDGSSDSYGADVLYTPQINDVVICKTKGTTASVVVNGQTISTQTVPLLSSGKMHLARDFDSSVKIDYIKITDTGV